MWSISWFLSSFSSSSCNMAVRLVSCLLFYVCAVHMEVFSFGLVFVFCVLFFVWLGFFVVFLFVVCGYYVHVFTYLSGYIAVQLFVNCMGRT